MYFLWPNDFCFVFFIGKIIENKGGGVFDKGLFTMYAVKSVCLNQNKRKTGKSWIIIKTNYTEQKILSLLHIQIYWTRV